jgi:serpin B
MTEMSPARGAVLRAAADSDDAFGADLFGMLGADGADVVFSPASISAALQMALCGARGQTALELATALHLTPGEAGPSPPARAAAHGLRLLSTVVQEVGATGRISFRAPNSLWIQAGLPLRPEFSALLREAAAVTIAEADFAHAPEMARAGINQVIEEQTGGRISGLLAPGAVHPATRLVLANAVYLKAPWAKPFPEHATSGAPFYPSDPGGPGGETMTVPTMRGSAARDYLRGDGYQTVLLSYRGDRLAMAIILPDGPLAALRSRLAQRGLRGLMRGATRHQVALAMPRFRLETTFGLIPALRRLGVRHAFGDSADFSGMTAAERLMIDLIVHKAYIDVDEHGTEAAAATAVGVRPTVARRTPPPVTMIIDRPFLFAITDLPTGLPLFLGQVTRPRP